jgi:hypothetical protein
MTPVAHLHIGLAGLDMDVARAQAEGFHDHLLDVFDDRVVRVVVFVALDAALGDRNVFEIGAIDAEAAEADIRLAEAAETGEGGIQRAEVAHGAERAHRGGAAHGGEHVLHAGILQAVVLVKRHGDLFGRGEHGLDGTLDEAVDIVQRVHVRGVGRGHDERLAAFFHGNDTV